MGIPQERDSYYYSIQRASLSTDDLVPKPLEVGIPTQLKNSVDPDMLISEKPADRDPHCFPLCF